MTIKSGFFNSFGGDRKYDVLDLSSIFDGVISDGVFATLGNIFAVTPGTGMQVLVDTGKAWFNHSWTVNDAMLPLSIEAADITLDRIDAVVLEVNNSDAVRRNDIKIVKGDISSRPSKPAMINTDDVHQYPLAYVTVINGSSSLSASNIEIVVGRGECPFVTGPLEIVPIDAIFAKWESEFNEWFDDLKITLEGDVAANLKKQIDDLDDKVNDHWEKTLSPETAVILGLDKSAVPDDAFNILSYLIPYDKGLIAIRAVDSSGKPAVRTFQVSPAINDSTSVTTDSSGFFRAVVPAGSYTVSAGGASLFETVTPQSVSLQIDVGGFGRASFTVDRLLSREVDITFSQEITIPDWLTSCDLFAVGGGGGGGAGSGSSSYAYQGSAGGGGGGYTSTLLNQNLAGNLLNIQIGAGGNGYSVSKSQTGGNGLSGGTTTIQAGGSTILSAKGGNGGDGSNGSHGRGGDGGSGGGGDENSGFGGTDGGNGDGQVEGSFSGGTGQGTTTRKFGESGNTLYSGGGGAGGYPNVSGAGGAGGGGSGSMNSNGGNATFYGGGGGGAGRSSASGFKGGDGYQGLVSIRWNLEVV